MIQSMTGFAEKTFALPRLRVKITLKSLNHRFWDWSYKGFPLGALESRLKNACRERIGRGRLEVALDLVRLDPSGWEIFINEALLAKLAKTLRQASSGAHAEARFDLQEILRLPYLAEIKPKALRRDEAVFLERCFERTLDALVRSREREGREIARQLRGHVKAIRRSLRRMEVRSRFQRGLLSEKFKRKLRGQGGGSQLTEEKLAQEEALQASRLDITEEMCRLRSHTDAVERCLEDRRGEPQGRMLDFLSQELLREANTINAKSQDLALIRETLSLKSEVENIRQQVQNLE